MLLPVFFTKALKVFRSLTQSAKACDLAGFSVLLVRDLASSRFTLLKLGRTENPAVFLLGLG